ncbi:MAG: ribosomal-processing cysteine protease Prp [Firmicutes bacterium]|nr:ribosomal-processing cysteine protease Prp [Bacillota bacterium]
MIQAKLFQDPEGDIYGYSVSGHAGYDEEGFDIICSAVSVLAINTANALENLLHLDLLTDMKDGYLKVVIPSVKDGNRNKEAQLLLETFRLGLESIIESYGSGYMVLSIDQN